MIRKDVIDYEFSFVSISPWLSAITIRSWISLALIQHKIPISEHGGVPIHIHMGCHYLNVAPVPLHRTRIKNRRSSHLPHQPLNSLHAQPNQIGTISLEGDQLLQRQ